MNFKILFFICKKIIKQNKFHCLFSANEDSIFLRHLELDPPVPETGPGRGTLKGSKGGRTPFTTTRRLARASGASFGFSIAWTHPPRYIQKRQ